MICAMNSATYDADILEWSEEQASALRSLARSRPDLSNELDWENVAEEIECVGRSEFAAVRSYIRQIIIHLISKHDASLFPEDDVSAREEVFMEPVIANDFRLKRGTALNDDAAVSNCCDAEKGNE